MINHSLSFYAIHFFPRWIAQWDSHHSSISSAATAVPKHFLLESLHQFSLLAFSLAPRGLLRLSRLEAEWRDDGRPHAREQSAQLEGNIGKWKANACNVLLFCCLPASIRFENLQWLRLVALLLISRLMNNKHECDMNSKIAWLHVIWPRGAETEGRQCEVHGISIHLSSLST